MSKEVYPKVQAKRSSAGLGLFAAEPIAKEQLILEYLGDRITAEEANQRRGRYLFEVTDNLVIDGKSRKNMARYCNHSCKPNAEAEHDESDDRIYYRACKKIAPGEEITISYGKDYFKQIIAPVGCKCAACIETT